MRFVGIRRNASCYSVPQRPLDQKFRFAPFQLCLQVLQKRSGLTAPLNDSTILAEVHVVPLKVVAGVEATEKVIVAEVQGPSSACRRPT